MKKVRVGVVGVGYLGKFHAEKYAGISEAELVGVVDVNGERASEIAALMRCRSYRDYHDLFGLVDAVSIAVPTPFHFEIAKEFLNHQ
ncbi:MAG: Gfo/Idh/MocA family oxidoreductase, partial [Thermodesulfobacteriota bacterium]